MRVSGFTLVRDGVRFGYPFVASIRSLLPLVDELIVACGDSQDDTRAQIAAIDSPKIRILDTVWDPELRRGGQIMSQQTNLALEKCTGDWCFYLQADEVLHENDYDSIRAAMQEGLDSLSLLGLWFNYKHFMGSYDICNPTFYARQVRVIRNGRGIRSVGDACGFAMNGRKLRARFPSATRSANASIFHYGWVKPPKMMGEKTRHFHGLYSGETTNGFPTQAELAKEAEWRYDFAACVPYRGPHPRVMQETIVNKDWETPPFHPVPLWRNMAWWRGRLRKAGLLRS